MSVNIQDIAFSGEITQFLSDWHQGDEDAMRDLIVLVYDNLRGMALHHLKKSSAGQTLPPTALISEVYLRLVEKKKIRLQNRNQFFWFAGQLMRNILVDYARAKQTAKRGAGEVKIPLDKANNQPEKPGLDLPTLVALDNALRKLEAIDPRHGRIIELRFFAGLNLEEMAEVLHLSIATIKREWQLAKHWLALELGGGGNPLGFALDFQK